MGLEALLSSQIIGLSEAIDDRTASLLVAGTGITLTYNDGAGTLTIANTGLGGSTGSTDNRILRSDGTGGATVQASAVTIDDSGNISGLGTISSTGAMQLQVDGSTRLTINSGISTTVTIANVGIICSRGIQIADADLMYWNNRSVMTSPSDGVIQLRNFAGTDFNRLQFGGTTSSFPSLKRSGATLQARLADDSAFANFSMALGFVGAYTVATLPSAAANDGAFARVTDSSVTTNGSTVAGGGSGKVPVFSDGTNWIVK